VAVFPLPNMSEYWKSTPKYWCKHCSTYVKDTAFERKQHEGTGKHQGNLKRFLRDIQNDHERNEREKQKAKAEVDRLNRVVGSASTVSTQSSSLQSTGRKTAGTPASASASDLKRQWAQLAEMGIKVPENFRSEMAMAGDWKVVSQKAVEDPSPEEQLNVGVRKRKYEGQEEEEEAGETVVRRGWGSTIRRYPGEDQADLDNLLFGTKIVKKETAVAKEEPAPKIEADATNTEEKKVGFESAQAAETEGNPSEPEDAAQLKPEKTENEDQPSLNEIPEATPVPVFKRRRAAKAVAT